MKCLPIKLKIVTKPELCHFLLKARLILAKLVYTYTCLCKTKERMTEPLTFMSFNAAMKKYKKRHWSGI